MQREKLYNLHKTTYSIVVLFISRVDRILASEPPSCKKDNIFDIWQLKFLLSHRSITKVGYQKRNTTQHEMQCERSTISTATLIVIVFKKRKILCDQFLQYSKFGPLRHCLFWKQEVQLRNKLSCVNCRAFRAVAYGMFWSLIQYVNERKINLSHLL